jgi:cytochrome b6
VTRRLTRLDPRHLGPALAAWFRERIDLGPMLAVLGHKTVPVHRQTWSYLLGGASLFLFALQIASGGLLMLYYQPAEATAHESVQKIAMEVPGGWFVRSVHAWGADLFIATVGLHLVVKLFTRAYRKPRELTWLTGMALLLVALAFGFSGYLLPWTELSYYATLVGTQIGGTVPGIGDAIVHVLRGGPQITGDTITRFYAAHVLWLPLATGAILAVHLALVQAQGQSIPVGVSPRDVRDAQPFFTEFLLLDLCVWLVLFGIIVTLASLMPAELGVKADPLKAAPPGIRPEWYFLFMFQVLKHVPEGVGVALFALGGAFLVLVPFLDRKASRGERSPGFTVLFAALIVVAACLEIWAWLTPGPQHAPVAASDATPRHASSVVTLVLLWALIAYLVFYLWQLLRQNTRIRKLYPRIAEPEHG